MVIEMGMSKRTTDVSTLHIGIYSHLAEGQRGWIALFTSEGRAYMASCCGYLVWHILSLSTCLCIHFLMYKIGRGLVYGIYSDMFWKPTSQGIKGQ